MPDGDLLTAIHGRRSVGRVSPEPLGREMVRELLEAAVSAPNHHLTRPWRFVVIAGDARRELGAAHLQAAERERGPLAPEAREKEAGRLERAPVVIACCVVPGGDDPVEAREDRDAVAAAIQTLLLAAHARGLAAMWRSGAMVDEPEVRNALGLGERDAIVGFVYLGRPVAEPARGPERPGSDAVTEWRGL